jgi:hypothetical protein
MAHESFESDEIAALMNEHFVNIKVDREERPDVDQLYMMAVQMLSGHGGWPMTVFLTPDGQPFYGGTYYPPEDRGPMAGFPRVLRAVAEAYRERKEQVVESAAQLTEHLTNHFSATLPGQALNAALLTEAEGKLANQFDRTNGGFGGAPKFPPSMTIELLLRLHNRTNSPAALQMADQTLDRMARGGLYDQVGGGFHRYTVDGVWLVPHFEKMLYDNAQLAHAYTIAWQATGEPFYRVVAEETLDYVLREMTSPDGGFYATQDADTEGHEGKFYIWTLDEFVDVLGPEAGRETADLLGVTERGNFEGANVLSIPSQADRLRWREDVWRERRRLLKAARDQRTWPGRDEKILTSWNGLMLRAFATAAWVFNDDRYAKAARDNARFLREHLWDGRNLNRSWKDGEAKISGFLEDYAFLADGLLALYGATFETSWLDWATELTDAALTEFYDPAENAFFDTGASNDSLVVRPRDAYDSATPSGTSVICDVLLRLSLLTGNQEYASVATGVLERLATIASEHPTGFSRLLSAIDLAVGPSAEVAVVGGLPDRDGESVFEVLRTQYLPRVVIAATAQAGGVDHPELLAGRTSEDGKSMAYVCVDHACQFPTSDPNVVRSQLAAALDQTR